MKFAISTICKNEVQFVERFVESCRDVDSLVIVDTGSTDGTREALHAAVDKREGADCVADARIVPWRFDDARNVALALVPPDVEWVIAMDLDEVLSPDWRVRLETAISTHPEANQWRIPYVWNHKPSGEADFSYLWEKVFARTGWRWVRPIHETLTRADDEPAVIGILGGPPMIEHWADESKPRSWYLDLMRRGLKENPLDERMRFYYERERLFRLTGEAGRAQCWAAAASLAAEGKRLGHMTEALHLAWLARDCAPEEHKNTCAVMLARAGL